MPETSELPTVLVVDDDEEWRVFVCRALSPSFRTRVATTGHDAMRLVHRSPPSLIVLDVMMPGGMDGFRVLCELRKNPATRDIPVMLCTAVNAATGLAFSPRELKRDLGVVPEAMLEKPVDAKRLLASAERAMQRARGKAS